MIFHFMRSTVHQSMFFKTLQERKGAKLVQERYVYFKFFFIITSFELHDSWYI